MTFTLPDELAAQFTHRVPARERSHYVAQALAEKLNERERNLIRACEIANGDLKVRAIENEFDSLPDEVAEPSIYDGDSTPGAPAR
jgi:hypothetical protein